MTRPMLTNSELGVKLYSNGAKNNPLVSSPGVNMGLNIVNMPRTPLYFHSRHGFTSGSGVETEEGVNLKKWTVRGLRSER